MPSCHFADLICKGCYLNNNSKQIERTMSKTNRNNFRKQSNDSFDDYNAFMTMKTNNNRQRRERKENEGKRRHIQDSWYADDNEE